MSPISFTVAAGEIVCLAGRNGAGKTSLLRCLLGLETKYRGSVKVQGQPVSRQTMYQVGAMIGGNSLYSHLSGRQNLDLFRRYYDLPAQVVAQTLDLMGLPTNSDKAVAHYSDGMKQRLAIGLAFIHRPALLVLDEPLNALDPEAIVDIRNLIKQLNRDFGTTFLISSHSLEEIGKVATRLLVLKQGRRLLDQSREGLEKYVTAEVKGQVEGEISGWADVYVKTDEGRTTLLGPSDQLASLAAAQPQWRLGPPQQANLEDIYLFVNQAKF